MDFLDRFSKIMGYSSLSEADLLLWDRQQNRASGSSLATTATVPYAIAQSFAIDNVVVLEQTQSFCLIKNSQTGLFSIWVKVMQTPLFKSTNWAAAYRTWIELLSIQRSNDFSQIPEVQSAEVLHDWVHRLQNDQAFGRLIYSRDLDLGGVLQYSVQLSEAIAIRWTAGSTSEGILMLDKISRRQHRLAKWIEPKPQAVIAAALHCAIDIFHQQWVYSLNQLNSEHWAKLVVTGNCCCDQLDEIVAYYVETEDPRTTIPEFLAVNLDAQEILKASLAMLHPEHFSP
jgi:hypothetical protein